MKCFIADDWLQIVDKNNLRQSQYLRWFLYLFKIRIFSFQNHFIFLFLLIYKSCSWELSFQYLLYFSISRSWFSILKTSELWTVYYICVYVRLSVHEIIKSGADEDSTVHTCTCVKFIFLIFYEKFSGPTHTQLFRW